MIRNIIFDVGQVLVDFRWRGYLQDLGFAPEVVECIGAELIQAPIWSELDLGVRPEKEVYEEMCQKLPQYRAQIRRFLDHPVDIVRPFAGTRSWLERLKARGYGIYLLSNYPKSMFALHAETSFNFMDIIDGKVVSAYEQKMKPQPEIYECLLERYGLEAEECVFLDDRPVNLEAAKKLGFHTIHVTDQERAMEELEKLLERH